MSYLVGDRMTRALNSLSAATARGVPAGKHEDGGGLRLVKGADGSGKWVLRMTVHGRPREMGLGPFPAVTLAQARRDAERWRAVVREGHDPIKERERERREAKRAGHLLRDVATDAFEARRADLKSDGAAGRWFSPLERHVLPKLGGVPVSDLDQQDIRNCLAPIWHEKSETARKAIQRLGLVIQHAAAMGLPVDIQAVAKACPLLGRSRHRPQHVPALPWRGVPAFYASLTDGTPTHLALRLLILTAVRSHPSASSMSTKCGAKYGPSPVSGRRAGATAHPTSRCRCRARRCALSRRPCPSRATASSSPAPSGA